MRVHFYFYFYRYYSWLDSLKRGSVEISEVSVSCAVESRLNSFHSEKDIKA